MEASTGAGKPPDPNKTKTNGGAESGLGAVGVVLAAVGGGIGVLTFVAFCGAAILWVRMEGAGLPPNEAVAVMPKSVLIATGAGFLAPSVIAALCVVGVLYVLDVWTASGTARGIRDLRERQERELELADARDAAAKSAREAGAAAVNRGLAQQKIAEELAGSEGVDSEKARQAGEEAQKALAEATDLQLESTASTQAAEQNRAAITKKFERNLIKTQGRIENRWWRNLRLALFLLVFVAGGVVALILFSVGFQSPDHLGILIAILAALGVVCLTILLRTESFPWFALATFVSVGIASGGLTYLRTADTPKVEPAAVLRTSGPPMYGFLVAQTTDRIYLGTTQPQGKWRLDAILREEVADMTVGELAPTEEANEGGRQLAIEACELARERITAGRVPVVQSHSGKKRDPRQTEPCSGTDLLHMREEAKAERVAAAAHST